MFDPTYRSFIALSAFKAAVCTYERSAIHALVLIDYADQPTTSLELRDQLRDQNHAEVLDWSVQKLEPQKANEHVQELLLFWGPSTVTTESSPV